VTVDGVDATIEIRGPSDPGRVDGGGQPAVRKELTGASRMAGPRSPGRVIEGRDIGSVVFPMPPSRCTSPPATPSGRPSEQGGPRYELRRGAADIARRDHIDSNRTTDPLTVADGAIIVDTTATAD